MCPDGERQGRICPSHPELPPSDRVPQCRHKFTCRHVKTVEQQLKDGVPELCQFQEQVDYDSTTTIKLPAVLSKNPIKSMPGMGDPQYTSSLNPGDIIHLMPDEQGTCPCGSPWSTTKPSDEGWLDNKCTLYSSAAVEEAYV